MKRLAALPILFLLFGASSLLAADYRAEVIDAPAPAEDLSADIVSSLSPTGVRVVRGEKRSIGEFWFCKEWPVEPGFAPTSEVLYPFQPGQLVGVLQLRRRGSDFRDQQISRGVYTLRYSRQPVDGNHEGTSPTRDFLLLVGADQDVSTAIMDSDTLSELSAEAAESSHPAMICLQPSRHDASSELPAMRHDGTRDWQILQVGGAAVSGADSSELVVHLVVAGHADE